MITSAFVETTHGSGHHDRLTRQAIMGLDAAGVPWEETTLKLIQRNRTKVRPDTLVVGGIPTVHAALQQLGCPPPEAEDYPEELRHLLRRRVWASTLRSTPAGYFVKPRQIKKFTGHVWPGYLDPKHGSANRRAPVWVSEPVSWVSEWRCFVVRGHVVGTQHYWGDPEVEIDVTTLLEAVQARPEAPWGYALDMGVLDSGETALVEQNLGYSLDHYQLDPVRYLEVLTAFWEWATP